jgi:hypothetical protein
LSHTTKWKEWLLRLNQHPDLDYYEILGAVIEETMEVSPIEEEKLEGWRRRKASIEAALRRNGLAYLPGARVVELTSGFAAEPLSEALRQRRFEALEVEFRRALENVINDPPSAITAACALLEALCRAYLESRNLELPKKQTIKPLWNAVQADLRLDPKDQGDQDIQKILSGIGSIVDGVGALRTHAGSAHGGGPLRYRVQSRHANLVVNSAHALALFLIETWDEKVVPF